MVYSIYPNIHKCNCKTGKCIEDHYCNKRGDVKAGGKGERLRGCIRAVCGQCNPTVRTASNFGDNLKTIKVY
jgi:hypothetical protein